MKTNGIYKHGLHWRSSKRENYLNPFYPLASLAWHFQTILECLLILTLRLTHQEWELYYYWVICCILLKKTLFKVFTGTVKDQLYLKHFQKSNSFGISLHNDQVFMIILNILASIKVISTTITTKKTAYIHRGILCKSNIDT